MANVAVGFDALRIHPLRTFLSVLGITIGCAALVATLAVSDGLLAFARDVIRRESSVQVVTVAPRRSLWRDGQWMPVHDFPVFGRDAVESLRRHAGSDVVAMLSLSGRTTVRLAGRERRAHLSLGTAAMPDFGAVDVGTGRFFAEMEVVANAPVVLVNHALARELLPGRDPYALVDREIHVGGHRRRVIGVLAPARFEDRDEPSFSVIAPIGAARALLAGGEARPAPVIRLLAPSVEAVESVHDAAVDWAARRYSRWAERVQVSMGLENLRRVEQSILLLELFVGALVGISLLVGGIGIMNVLLASVAERTREIGIRKSVGARRADIAAQFLTEAVAIALVGACAGVVLGMAIAFVVTVGFQQLAGVAVRPVLSPAAVLAATLSSSGVGLLFGTYPARRAAALPPVVAIAQES